MKTSRRTFALLSGVSLIVMAITAGYSYGYVQNRLVVPNDLDATFTNFKLATALFGSGVMGWIIILITDLLVAWGLYKYYLSVNKKVSIATGIMRGIYSAILAIAIYQLVAAWLLLQTDSANALILSNSLKQFELFWSLGLIIFGAHLMGLGYLAIKSNSTPTWLGWLLCIAGISYALLNGVKACAPSATETIAIAEMSMAAPMALSEIGLAIWLIWKGGRNENKPN